MRGKRFLGMIAVGSAAVLMLSGFASAMTVQELQEKAKSALAQVNNMVIEMEGNAAAAMSISDGTEGGQSMDIPIKGNVELYMNMVIEPLQLAMEVSYEGEAMGQGGSGGIGMAIMEAEDGTGTAYMISIDANGEDSGWQAAPVDAETITQAKESLRTSLSGDVSALGSNPALQGTEVNMEQMASVMNQISEQVLAKTQIEEGDGTYIVTGNLTGADFSAMLPSILEASGQEVDNMSLQMVQTVVSGLVMNMVSEFDANTYLPISAEIDMSQSDFSGIADLMMSSMMGGAEGVSAQINVDELNLSFTANFTDVEPITLPQEALDAAAALASGGGTTDTSGGVDIGGLIGQNLTGGTDTTDTGTDTTGTGTDTTIPSDDPMAEAIKNPDGSYLLTYEKYDGTVNKANVFTPEGTRPSYGNESYVSFKNDTTKTSVSFTVLGARATEEETLADAMDTTFMEGNEDYSEISKSDVRQVTLDNGTVVYYGTATYLYGGYRLGGTFAVLKAGDSIVKVEVQAQDAQYNVVEADEATVKTMCNAVAPAA